MKKKKEEERDQLLSYENKKLNSHSAKLFDYFLEFPQMRTLLKSSLWVLKISIAKEKVVRNHKQ